MNTSRRLFRIRPSVAAALIGASLLAACSGNADRQDMELQARGLYDNAKRIFSHSPVPNADITGTMIASMAVTASPSDPKVDEALKRLRIDEGTPAQRHPARIMHGKDVEVRIVGKDGNIYVHFIGASSGSCAGVEHAVCQ